MEQTVRDALDVVIPIVEALGAVVVFAGALHASSSSLARRCTRCASASTPSACASRATSRSGWSSSSGPTSFPPRSRRLRGDLKARRGRRDPHPHRATVRVAPVGELDVAGAGDRFVLAGAEVADRFFADGVPVGWLRVDGVWR